MDFFFHLNVLCQVEMSIILALAKIGYFDKRVHTMYKNILLLLKDIIIYVLLTIQLHNMHKIT